MTTIIFYDPEANSEEYEEFLKSFSAEETAPISAEDAEEEEMFYQKYGYYPE